MKRGWTNLLLCILLLPIAFAAHSASVSTNYVSVYETNNANITITIQNSLFSTASVNKVKIQENGFTINSIIPLLGWNVNNSIFSTTTNAISNWGSQNFGFGTKALNVNQDTTYNWTVITTDTSNAQQTNQLQLTVLNDNTPPVLGAIQPGPFNLGKNNEAFSIAASDPETGIANANLHLSNCDLVFNNATNTSSRVYTTYPLSCSSGICSTTKDLSSWPEGDICYYFDVSNNGGASITSANQTSIIDRTAPVVKLVSPINNTFFNGTTIALTFNATDNYDTNPSCIITVNSATYAYNASSGSNAYNLPVNDGIYSWHVACSDKVALTGTSGTRSFTVDNQGPNITITAPAVVNRGSNAVITTLITDTGSGVDQSSVAAEIIDTNNNVTAVTITNNQITYPTTITTQPGTYAIKITARDNLGHQSVQTTQFRIRETYVITLSLSKSQIDASTANLTRYVNATGDVVKDDGTVPAGTVDFIAIIANQTLPIDNQTGAYQTQVQIPQTNGLYTVIASYTNGADTFTITKTIGVGPYCGNGVVDAGEQCDGSTTAVCSAYGFSQGTTSCTASCKISTSQCSNPPQQSSSGGRRGGSSGSSSGFVVTQTVPVIQQPVPVQQDLHSGIIVQPAPVEPVAQPASGNYTTEPQSSSFGIGAAWSALIRVSETSIGSLILALLLISVLLYTFGWKKRSRDDWDSYFNKVRKNYP